MKRSYFPFSAKISRKIGFFPWLILTGIALLFSVYSGSLGSQKNTVKIQSQTPVEENKTNRVLAKVIRVIDGDTFAIDLQGKKETVRLIGVDTPEIVDPRKPVQCFAKEASDKAKEILTGKNVNLESDPSQGDRDKYGRLLRFAFLEDGTNFNKLMIAEGFAHQYTYLSKPYKYLEEFQSAEKEARENKKGLWKDGVCIY